MEGFTAEVVLVAQALDVVGLYGAAEPNSQPGCGPDGTGFSRTGCTGTDRRFLEPRLMPIQLTAPTYYSRGDGTRVGSGRQRGNTVDLNKLVPVPEHRNPEQGAGRPMWRQTGRDDIPNRDKVRASPNNIDGRLHKVRRPGAVAA